MGAIANTIAIVVIVCVGYLIIKKVYPTAVLMIAGLVLLCCAVLLDVEPGLALKKGITVLNSPGTIDADYRGEICIILVNLSSEPFEIRDGERIAQMVVASYEQAGWKPVESLDETERGAGGFGHSGEK